MGEISDLIFEGVLCQVCGCLLEDLIVPGTKELKDGPGYPRSCPDCLKGAEVTCKKKSLQSKSYKRRGKREKTFLEKQ